MKKILYSLASLAVLAGCAKEAAPVQQASPKTIDLTLRVDQNATKTAFDGDSHIKWLAGDDLAVMIDYNAESLDHTGAWQYGKFTIGQDLENPVFTGSMTLMDDKADEEMWVYGIYPYSAIPGNRPTKIHGREVILPAAQTFTQSSWDGKADLMALDPVQLTGTPGGSSGNYTWASELTVKFAHLFGFGCLSFAGLPADLASESLVKVIITATNAEASSNPMAGNFSVNLEQDITLEGNAPAYLSSAKNTLTLTAAEPAALKDSKVWFVANPGTYDVTITAVTAGHKVTYERKGLVIERSKIAKPVINLKDADVVSSTSVDVTGKSWIHNATDAYAAGSNAQFFKNGTTSVDWGTNQSDLMEMNLSYVGAGSGYYGTPQNKDGIYAQDFNYSSGKNLSGVVITVASSSSFIGMKSIKVSAGDYKAPSYSGVAYTSKISVFVTDADGKHQLGTAQEIVGSTDDRKGADFYFEAGNYTSGVLTIELSDFSHNYACPYISALEINPIPGIEFSSYGKTYLADAVEGEFDCFVATASEAPVATTDVDWITASYANGKVTYSVAANTTNESRTGNVSVSAYNDFGSRKVNYTITQIGAQYKEYTLELSYNDIKAALLAARQAEVDAEKTSFSTTYSFDINATATAEDESEIELTLRCNNIRYDDSVTAEAICVYGGGTYGYIQSVTPVYAVTAAEVVVSKDEPVVKVGKTSADETVALTSAAADGMKVYTGSANLASQNAYFSVGTSSWSYKSVDMSSVKIIFVNE